jgi:hypothetical protein
VLFVSEEELEDEPDASFEVEPFELPAEPEDDAPSPLPEEEDEEEASLLEELSLLLEAPAEVLEDEPRLSVL